MKERFLFLTLNTFSATGGIEKVCRVAGKALHDIAIEEGDESIVFSMYDRQEEADEKYLPASSFKGFGGRKLQFVWRSIKKGRECNILLLSHINLILVGYLIKKVSPKTKLLLIAHGIELWQPLLGLKKKMLKAVDLFLPVSSFTGEKLQNVHGISSSKIKVVNNCLDPFLRKSSDPEKERALKTKYGFSGDDFVLFTLTRLKFSEQYKGYDKVVTALAELKKTHAHIKYLIVGRYDTEEKERLDKIIAEHNMNERVVFAGFVADADLGAHFNIANAYIMPSTGEGFGVVFIEALFHGLPVIAGNVDGSVDALNKGQFGLLVNPHRPHEIVDAIEKLALNNAVSAPEENVLMEKFGFETYKRLWTQILHPKTTARKTRIVEADRTTS